ncbi:MAG TPA: hypothetical protein VMV69_08025 [Pirellulales bacterium]|nr:hypothetical protein [Pirellulales bacterium]
MMRAILAYLNTLCQVFGRGWNRFWFTPSDAFALAPVRIGAGLMAFYLVATYTPDLETFFGDNGLLPVESLKSLERQVRDDNLRSFLPATLRETLPRQYRFSYLDYLDDRSGLWAAHIAGLVVLALFAAGCFTRVTSILSLVVFLSYVHRGPMLTAQVEPILAFVMFYLCLGPAGRSLSVDAWLAARRPTVQPRQTTAVSPCPASVAATVSIRLIQVHLTLAYAMMAIGKLAGEVWWNGLGMWWLIARPEMRLVDWTGLAAFPKLVAAWTHFQAAFELGFAVLIWNRTARPLLLALSVVAWLLLAPVTGLVTYSLMMLVANLAFVSPAWLRSVRARRAPALI